MLFANGVSRSIPLAAFDALIQCKPFRTILHHAQVLAAASFLRNIGLDEKHNNSPAFAKRLYFLLKTYALQFTSSLPRTATDLQPPFLVLQMLKKEGLLESEDEVRRACCARTTNDSRSTNVTTLAILGVDPTAPDHFIKKCLRSMAHRRSSKIISVSERSYRYPAAPISTTLEWLQAAGAPQIEFADLLAKEQLAQRLISGSGVRDEVVRFAIFGMSRLSGGYGGAVRNFLLLRSAGTGLLVLDASRGSRCYQSADFRPGLSLVSGYPDQSLQRESCGGSKHELLPWDGDYVEAHERILGRSVGDCASEASGRGSLFVGESDASMSRKLEFWGGTVAVTLPDCANNLSSGSTRRPRDPFPVPSLRPKISAKQSDSMVPRDVITTCARLENRSLAFDNSRLLPPFCPAIDQYDSVFQASVKVCFPNYYFGILPIIMSLGSSSGSTFTEMTPGKVCTSTILLSLLRWAKDRLSIKLSGAEALRELGELHVEIGGLQRRAFVSFIREELYDAITEQTECAERHSLNGPKLKDAALRGHARFAESVFGVDGWVPEDLVRLVGLSEARSACQELLRLYGMLLIAWPALVACSSVTSDAGPH